VDKEQKKLLISEPQGDLRHTCHVGLDGKVFGLIHVSLDLDILWVDLQFVFWLSKALLVLLGGV
jgi:hypothetical protein